MPKRSSKGRKDVSTLAKSIVDQATDEIPQVAPKPARGHAGGIKGGKARAIVLTPARRKEIAKKAAETRWKVSVDDE